jgi:low affinity Fe/Cu permease
MKTKKNLFERFANWATIATGSSTAFILAIAVIVVWGVSGPIFKYSDTWQLVINTGTTIITFLMVFLIQKSQNKDSLAIQLKLNELVAAHDSASNKLVSVENMTEEELKVIQKYYLRLSDFLKSEKSLEKSNQIGQAQSIKEEMEKELKDIVYNN